jgi:hypothetical protein
VTYSNTFTKRAGAALLVVGATVVLPGCSTTPEPVNQTVHEPAVSDKVVKISRCAENGFHVAQANAYNMGQVQQNFPNYRAPISSLPIIPIGGGGISSQLLYTANSTFIIQYPKAFTVNNEIFSKLAGAVVGAGIGGGYGRVVGATLGVAVLGPIFEAVSDKLSGPAEIQKHIKLAECISDLAALNGGLVQGPASDRAFIRGVPVQPRPRW